MYTKSLCLGLAKVYRKYVISSNMVSRICPLFHCVMNHPAFTSLRYFYCIAFSWILYYSRRNSQPKVAAGAEFILCPALEDIGSMLVAHLMVFSLQFQLDSLYSFSVFRCLSASFAEILISMEIVFFTYYIPSPAHPPP